MCVTLPYPASYSSSLLWYNGSRSADCIKLSLERSAHQFWAGSYPGEMRPGECLCSQTFQTGETVFEVPLPGLP